MSKNNTFETELLQHIFENADIANVGDATGLRGSTTAGSFHVGLHTADPGEAGAQNTSEATYTGYARAAVARAGAQWTATNDTVTNDAEIAFPENTGASQDIFFWSLGTSSSGAGKVLYRGHFGGAPKAFTAATNDNITCPAHGLAVNDRVVFYSRNGQSLPTGITEGTVYFVLTAADANTITISATQGGSVIDITAVGVGVLAKVVPLTVGTNVTPKIPASGLTIRDE